MVVLLIALVLVAGTAIFAVVAAKQKRSRGKLAVIPTALAVIFAIAFCIIPASIHIVETGEIAVRGRKTSDRHLALSSRPDVCGKRNHVQRRHTSLCCHREETPTARRTGEHLPRQT